MNVKQRGLERLRHNRLVPNKEEMVQIHDRAFRGFMEELEQAGFTEVRLLQDPDQYRRYQQKQRRKLMFWSSISVLGCALTTFGLTGFVPYHLPWYVSMAVGLTNGVICGLVNIRLARKFLR